MDCGHGPQQCARMGFSRPCARSLAVAVRGHRLQPWLGAAFVRGRGLPGTCDAGSWAMAVRDGHEPQPCGGEGVCDPALWGGGGVCGGRDWRVTLE